jgi:hypothetical protein
MVDGKQRWSNTVPEGQLIVARRFNAGWCRRCRVPEGRLKRFHKCQRFVSAVPTARAFSRLPTRPATEVAGYYQWSLRDR